MNRIEATRVAESLRRGLPPTGYVREFTAGRKQEIEELSARLDAGTAGALLLRANYGAGKTHLLRFIGETALAHNYVLSYLTVDSTGGVRFNRMDQILGAICRGLQVPERPDERGVGPFLDGVCDALRKSGLAEGTQAGRLSTCGAWSHNHELESIFMFVAVRAWFFSGEHPDKQDLVEDWLHHPDKYASSDRWLLDRSLVDHLAKRCFPKGEYTWCHWGNRDERTFAYNYPRCWEAVRDLQTLARIGGYRGLVILFDEVEDIIWNLGRIDLQFKAFWNLVDFFNPGPGIASYFAVTPQFSEKCLHLIHRRGYRLKDETLFEKLPAFEMSPLSRQDLDELSLKIVRTHEAAYGWDSSGDGVEAAIATVLNESMAIPVQDRVRRAIKAVVSKLDECYDTATS